MKDLIESLNRAHELDEAAFSGGYAEGGNVIDRHARPGASVQPDKKSYLGRLKNKNPDLVDIITVKGKDIQRVMITQSGQVKEAEVKKNNRGETKVYIMHTNNYDGFWDVDQDMEVLADPENRSKPFTGDYRALLKMGLKESAIYNRSMNESSDYEDRASRLSDRDLDDMIDMLSDFSEKNPDNSKYSDYLNALKSEKASRNSKAQYANSRRAKRDDFGLDRKYPYYVTLYNEYPIYEPAEGGYYYAGLATEAVEGFDSFKEAADAIDGIAQELNSNDYNLVKKSTTEYRDEGDKYIGTGAVLCVENNKQFRSRERGRVPYC